VGSGTGLKMKVPPVALVEKVASVEALNGTPFGAGFIVTHI